MPNVACSARPTAGATGPRPSTRTTIPGAIDLSFEPGNPEVVYAAMWQTRRPPWNVYPPSYGPGSGLYKSTDGGRSWHQLTGHGLPAHPSRIGLATSPAKPHRVYALVDSAKPDQGGLYRSDDSGASWRKVTGDKRIWGRGWYFGEVDANPKNADQLWVNNTIILRSRRRRRAFHSAEGRSHRRRFPQHVDRPEEPRPANSRSRPGHARHPQRRKDVEQLVQPADRAILSRHDRQSIPVPDLRRAAGFGRGGGRRAATTASSTASTMTDFHEVDRRRRERRDRARPARSGHRLWRPGRPARPQVRAGRGASTRRSPSPTITATPGPCR